MTRCFDEAGSILINLGNQITIDAYKKLLATTVFSRGQFKLVKVGNAVKTLRLQVAPAKNSNCFHDKIVHILQ